MEQLKMSDVNVMKYPFCVSLDMFNLCKWSVLLLLLLAKYKNVNVFFFLGTQFHSVSVLSRSAPLSTGLSNLSAFFIANGFISLYISFIVYFMSGVCLCDCTVPYQIVFGVFECRLKYFFAFIELLINKCSHSKLLV